MLRIIEVISGYNHENESVLWYNLVCSLDVWMSIHQWFWVKIDHVSFLMKSISTIIFSFETGLDPRDQGRDHSIKKYIERVLIFQFPLLWGLVTKNSTHKHACSPLDVSVSIKFLAFHSETKKKLQKEESGDYFD